MRARVLLLALSFSLGAAPLKSVYQNNDFQLTGVTMSKEGRLFVNFPRWSDRYLNAVLEVLPNGSTKPYPDTEWNQWNLKPDTAGNHWVCVQSIVVDDNDQMWVVDAAAPLLATTVPGGPKLVQIDLKSNKVQRVFAIGPDVALIDSYMNDIRIDNARGFAYLTDSGHGGLIVLDIKAGKAHRALDGHPSVMTQPGVKVVVDGKELLQFGKPPQFKADSLALSPDGNYVYYKAITADKLYRIRTDLLRNANSSRSQLESAVETVAKVFPTDGLWMDKHGILYLSDVQQNAVVRMTPDGKQERVASDANLQWPDTFTEGPDGAIYISASHINEGPNFNAGKSVRKTPYAVFRFKP
jgi:sugar lactone lactonase YvrE